MVEGDPRRELGGAVYRGVGEAVVAQLAGSPWPDDALQVIGDGLRLAVAAGIPGAGDLARRCIDGLDERGWTGDDDLAAALRAEVGLGPTPLLRPLPVDLDELSSALEGDLVSGGGRIDRRTGEVWQGAAIDDGIGELPEDEDEDEEDTEEEDVVDDPDRWLFIDAQGSGPGYRDMQRFIDGLTDPEIADRLGIAIIGRGAFRRFKDVLSRWPDIQQRWYSFSDERSRGRARAWLADEGYTPVPRGRSGPVGP